MKTLVLVRHGKSSWDYKVHDKDRPLQEKGINDAHKVAAAFKKQDIHIDAVFSSPANRALHTCMIFLRELNFPFSNFQVTNELYNFSGESVLRFIKNLNNTFETIMIFGHNYALTNIANTLGSTSIDNVPTSGLVQLSFDVAQWESIVDGITEKTIFPKQLR